MDFAVQLICRLRDCLSLLPSFSLHSFQYACWWSNFFSTFLVWTFLCGPWCAMYKLSINYPASARACDWKGEFQKESKCNSPAYTTVREDHFLVQGEGTQSVVHICVNPLDASVCRVLKNVLSRTWKTLHIYREQVRRHFLTEWEVIQVAVTLTRNNERLPWKMNAKYLARKRGAAGARGWGGREEKRDAWIWDDSTHYTHFTRVTMTFWQAFCLRQKSLRGVPDKKKKSEKVSLCVCLVLPLLLHLHFKGDTRRRDSF